MSTATTARTLTVAMGQMLVEGGAPARNLPRAVAMIRDAAARGCEVIVLPECLDLGWTHPSAHEGAEPIPGPRSAALSEAASAANIHVVAGLTERDGDRIFNTAILIAPSGKILLTHRKINILDIALDLYAIGDRLGVAETALGTVGVNICADNFPDALVLGHSLARMGAQMILSPTAWAVEADHDHDKNPCRTMWVKTYTELARLYDIPVIGVSNVGWLRGGPWDGRQCIGYSLAVGRGGRVLAEGPHGPDAEALIPVEIEITPRIARGTQIEAMLSEKGCAGP